MCVIYMLSLFKITYLQNIGTDKNGSKLKIDNLQQFDKSINIKRTTLVTQSMGNAIDSISCHNSECSPRNDKNKQTFPNTNRYVYIFLYSVLINLSNSVLIHVSIFCFNHFQTYY